MTLFVLDVETLSTESYGVVLSLAITAVPDDMEEVDTFRNQGRLCMVEDVRSFYHNLLNNYTIYVKFDAREQATAGRHIGQDTLDWWNKQDVEVKKLAFLPSHDDVSVADGIQRVKAFMNKHGERDKRRILWARGGLDAMILESLCKHFKIEPLVHYSAWRDIRTAIDIAAETSTNGYCELFIPFDKTIVVKHDPRHDCVYDCMQLLFMK